NSIYSGITGEWINPSFIAGSPYIVDINLVTAQSYFDNNYVYLFPTNVLDLLDDDGENKIKIDNTQQREHGTWAKYMLENKDNNNWRKNAYLNALVQGPSFMFNFKKWSFSIEDAARADISIVRVSPVAARLLYEDSPRLTYLPLQNKQLEIPKFRINGLVWDELGITIARQIINNRDWEVNGGITLKHLDGYAGGYCLNKGVNITVPNDSTIYFKDLSVKAGYAANLNHPVTVCGSGASTDLGVTFKKKTIKNSYQCPNFCDKELDLQYLWKLGISLVDIGYINFNGFTNNYTINNSTDDWVNITKMHTKGINGFDSVLKAHFSNLVNSKSDFTMMLPWAASVQFDYNIGYNIYLNGTWVQRIPHFGLPGVDRANSISITPRYDTRRFGVALPIVFYEYLWPRVGIAFRFNNFLIIGSDKIGAIFSQSLSGEDFYFSFKFNILKSCKKHKKKGLPSFLPEINLYKQQRNH
ncbi:MAG: DUF5723 family protein, partial [Bacteroidales bacterium]